jgi:hypothetical protein
VVFMYYPACFPSIFNTVDGMHLSAVTVINVGSDGLNGEDMPSHQMLRYGSHQVCFPDHCTRAG